MISNYKVKYSETEDVLIDVCRVNAAEKVVVCVKIPAGLKC